MDCRLLQVIQLRPFFSPPALLSSQDHLVTLHTHALTTQANGQHMYQGTVASIIQLENLIISAPSLLLFCTYDNYVATYVASQVRLCQWINTFAI